MVDDPLIVHHDFIERRKLRLPADVREEPRIEAKTSVDQQSTDVHVSYCCSRMSKDFTIFLWLLKLGALANIYFFVSTLALKSGATDPHIIIPAQILFAVSAYRCVFPNRYKDNIVLHATVLSSTLVTRTLATLVEVAWIYQFSHVIRSLNVEHVGWVDALSWLMFLEVIVSQIFVWFAILSGRLSPYFYEELGWAVIFVANTIASAYLYTSLDSFGGRETLLQLNLLFGVVYLPWQIIHLRSLRADARTHEDTADPVPPLTLELLANGFSKALHQRNRATDASSWGGIVGLTWMTAYWATLIPYWIHQVVQIAAVR
jgi:hypothetical protein